jgi:hypothetical protein
MEPNKLAIFVLFAWPLIMIILGMIMPIRRVVLISIIGGNLFLPPTGIVLSGMPNYTKLLAAGIGALLPAFIFAFADLTRFRPKLLDMFFIGFLIAPGISSILNGLGPYDAVSVTINRFLEWGVAYWLGRTLFTDLPALRDLCIAVVVSGMLYAPLCMYEIVMSPQLNRIFYGFRPSEWVMTKRLGGWRPMVFMQHGLALAAWMAAAALVAWVLWRSKAIRNIWGIPISWIAIGLVILTILLRSTGAAMLLLGLIATAEFIQTTRLRPLLLVLVIAPIGYIGLRTVGWEGNQLVELVAPLGDERAGSLNMRLENDQMIVDKVMHNRPVFGWGGWGRWRVQDDWGNDITVSDSWWSILVGTTGIFGLACTYAIFISPLFPLSLHKSRRRIFIGPLGAAWAIGLGILLFVIDSLANAMPNTSFIIMAATLVSVYALVSPKAIQRMMAQQQRRAEAEQPNDEHDDAEHADSNGLKTA